jgi:hypothetical protein
MVEDVLLFLCIRLESNTLLVVLAVLLAFLVDGGVFNDWSGGSVENLLVLATQVLDGGQI